MKKRMMTLALTLALGGVAAAPALADHRSDYPYTGRYRQRSYDVSSRRDALVNRADRIAQMAEDMYRSGDLSVEHRDRTVEKLRRVWDDVDSRRLDDSRLDADMRWMDQVESTLHEWSAADSRNGSRNYRTRRYDRNYRDYRDYDRYRGYGNYPYDR